MSTYLLNFKREFSFRVERGEKRQTIRRHRADGKRMQPGDVLKLYTGLRTKDARLLRTATVERCRSVRMDFEDDSIVIDGAKLTWEEKLEFAQADGFKGWADMRQFFKDQYGLTVFEGFCVEWKA